MDYQKIIEIVAKKHNTTPKEVDEEIRRAIDISGYKMSPLIFIKLISTKIKTDYIS